VNRDERQHLISLDAATATAAAAAGTELLR